MVRLDVCKWCMLKEEKGRVNFGVWQLPLFNHLKSEDAFNISSSRGSGVHIELTKKCQWLKGVAGKLVG